MPPHKVAISDVFTSTPFKGNQLGIVHVSSKAPLAQEVKQKVAREFGYSETVFIHDLDIDDGGNGRRVDIFTPTDELPFAGHPTIGSIHYIATRTAQSSDRPIPIRLNLKAGPVHAFYSPSTRTASAEVPQSVHIHSGTVAGEEVLGSQPGLGGFCVSKTPASLDDVGDLTALGRKHLDPASAIVSIVKGMTFECIRMPSVQALGALQPGATGTADLDEGWETVVRGQMFFYLLGPEDEGGTDGEGGSGNGNTVVRARTRMIKARTRMLETGIGEDAATGSASCALASYLALEKAKGSDERVWEFEFTQGVEMGRRSVIGVDISLDGSGTKVLECALSGSAVVVLRGEMDIE